MTKLDVRFAAMIAGVVLSLSTIGIIVAGNDPITATDRDIQLRTNASGETPVNHGRFRIIPGDHPEASVFARLAQPPTAEQLRHPIRRAHTLNEAKAIIPSLKVPILPSGLTLQGIDAWSSTWHDSHGAELTYLDTVEKRSVGIVQRTVLETLIPVLKSPFHPFEELILGEVNGVPALLWVPRSTAPQKNTRTIRWVEGNIDHTVYASGFSDLQSVLAIVSSLKRKDQ